MKNIYLNIMSKSVAPTELKPKGLFPFYKGATPTELFIFTKLNVNSVSILETINSLIEN